LALLLCLSLTPSAFAAKTPELIFRRFVDLPAINLRIKLMPDCTEAPIAPPTVYRWRRHLSAGGEQIVENNSVLELWRNSQQAGKWTDKDGNALQIAVATMAPPTNLFARQYMTREEYDAAITESRPPPVAPTSEALTEWATFYSGAKAVTLEPIPKHAPTLQELVGVSLEGYPGYTEAYAFRLKRTSPLQTKVPTSWFFVTIEINPLVDMKRARRAIMDEFLQNVMLSQSAPVADAEPSKVFQNREAMKSVNRSPELMASRKQVADSIKNMKNWWFVETEDYIILSDLQTRHHVMVQDLQANIGSLRTAFEKIIPPRTNITAISVIRVFGTPEEYESYVPADFSRSSGIWMPDRKELVIRPIDWGGNDDQRTSVFGTTYHEAFHQYLFYALGQLHADPWFNEGFASFFGGANVKENKLKILENELLAKKVGDLLNNINIESIIGLSYDDFYARDDKTGRSGNSHYVLAWALVYYLSKGIAIEPQSPYAGILDRYVDALWTTKNPTTATQMAFKGIDMHALNKDFVKFWQSPNKRAAAVRNRLPCEGK
jgi:hypothetical protein